METKTWFSTPVAVLMGAVLIAASIIAAGSGAGLSFLKGSSGDTLQPTATPPIVVDSDAVATDDDPSIGGADAPVTIVEFSDFQCPYCRRFSLDTYPQIKRDYIDTGKVRLIFRDYPLPPQYHPAADLSAQGGECAQEQGKFEAYHDIVFVEQEKLGLGTVDYGADELKQWARSAGLDGAAFDACLDSGKYAEETAADAEDGRAVGVSGTPSFFVNGFYIEGAEDYSVFKEAIDAALAD